MDQSRSSLDQRPSRIKKVRLPTPRITGAYRTQPSPETPSSHASGTTAFRAGVTTGTERPSIIGARTASAAARERVISVVRAS